MCTLCLSDMGELRDDWLREPKKAAPPIGGVVLAPPAAAAAAGPAVARPAAVLRALADQVSA